METASLKFQDPQLHCLLNSTSISDTSHLETINVCLDNADLQLCQLEKVFQPIPKPGQNYWSTTHKAQLKLYAGCTKRLFETIHLIDIMDWYRFYSSAPCFSSCIWWVVLFCFFFFLHNYPYFNFSAFTFFYDPLQHNFFFFGPSPFLSVHDPWRRGGWWHYHSQTERS